MSSKGSDFFIDWVDTYKDKRSLYLWSNLNSTLKTSTAKWLAKCLVAKDLSLTILFGTFSEFIFAETKKSFNSDSMSLSARSQDSDIIVCDDAFSFDKTHVSQSRYEISYIDTFLRRLLESDKKCIITSNRDPDNIYEFCGAFYAAFNFKVVCLHSNEYPIFNQVRLSKYEVF